MLRSEEVVENDMERVRNVRVVRDRVVVLEEVFEVEEVIVKRKEIECVGGGVEDDGRMVRMVEGKKSGF